MKLAQRFRLTVLLAAIATTAVIVGAQTPAIPPNVAAAKLDDVVPVDPQITVGTLPNGLRYYIRLNRQPQGRAELRLAVNAGSVLEDEDQRGLAHFVEHMAFNGTLHFPQLDVVNFMQSLGMRFGAHVNANTSFDETIYELQIPTENPVVIDRALLALEDWAHNVTFDPTEIDKERGVILEEWRQGLGAGERISNKQFPMLLKGSRYADRLPIGTPEIIQNANPARLKQFYADWYRPDMMAVVVVGDVDKAAVDAMIKAHFGAIPTNLSPEPCPPRRGSFTRRLRTRKLQRLVVTSRCAWRRAASSRLVITVDRSWIGCSAPFCLRASTRLRTHRTPRFSGRRPIAACWYVPRR